MRARNGCQDAVRQRAGAPRFSARRIIRCIAWPAAASDCASGLAKRRLAKRRRLSDDALNSGQRRVDDVDAWRRRHAMVFLAEADSRQPAGMIFTLQIEGVAFRKYRASSAGIHSAVRQQTPEQKQGAGGR
eukprot:CAMPEP_0176101200 /NCGR_PEP_ID=MMETSP0120_2-20121206/50760_1 /TAXON_ID=160619 /ORGANISM="Kryptoperidinium foliaceum, Strain CCMP 1326" /LENGTH=130 /DNA_ID=CAMNT_0017435253 /DNA_START=50 /DNA_END=440 /DNA_ORIENTATION=+